MKVELEVQEGEVIEEDLKLGEIKRVELAERQEAMAVISPAKDFDMGEGPGHTVECKVIGGVAGVLLDARGRPLYLPDDEGARKGLLLKWFTALNLYPEDKLKELI